MRFGSSRFRHADRTHTCRLAAIVTATILTASTLTLGVAGNAFAAPVEKWSGTLDYTLSGTHRSVDSFGGVRIQTLDHKATFSVSGDIDVANGSGLLSGTGKGAI